MAPTVLGKSKLRLRREGLLIILTPALAPGKRNCSYRRQTVERNRSSTVARWWKGIAVNPRAGERATRVGLVDESLE